MFLDSRRSLLDRLQHQVSSQPALPALTKERYAFTHARFEAASDQRSLLQDWLVRTLPPLFVDRDPLRVVGVGVGDGSLDAPIAAALAVGARRVHYTGIEPHAASAASFAAQLAALSADGLTPAVVIGDFADFAAHQRVDLVHFVHSLYYTADLSAALDKGLSILERGGVLLTATAPLRPLCVMTELLCPWGGQQPFFADDVRRELALRGLAAHSETLTGQLDLRPVLDDPLGRGEALLDFLIGARSVALQTTTRELLLDYLRDISLPDRPGVVPHPLEIAIARIPQRLGE